MIRKSLAKRLKKSKTPLSHIATKTGIDISTLSRICSGERNPSGVAVDQLAKYFGLKLIEK